MTRLALALTACLGLSLFSSSLAADDESGFMSLFNGKDLAGWRKVGGGATYRVDGDSIVGEVGPGANTFLRSEKLYGNFILKLDARLDVPGNSGIQLRSHQKNGDGQTFGYQCEIDPTDRAWTAGIYDEGRRGWLYPLTGHPEAQKAFRRDDWNSFVIVACGPSIKTWINDVQCADLIDTMDLEGFIALQVHAGKEGRIRWKNVRLKELAQSKWQPLWDGKSLDGWKKIGGGSWAIEDGAVHGTSTSGEARHGHLITNNQYSDFAVRLKYKSTAGNSGLYFRVVEGGGAGVQGFQAEIDPANDVGGLYETDGRGWVVQPKADDVKKWSKPGEWNDMSVVAWGKRLVVHVNGVKTAEVNDEKGRRQGHIALQLHGGQNMDVQFKDIELLELDKLQCQ